MTTKTAATTTTTTNGHKCPECGEMFSAPQVLGRHRLFKHKVLGKSRSANYRKTNKLRCPDCNATFSTERGLGGHRSKVHGVLGMSRSSMAARGATPPKYASLACPHCNFTAKHTGGLTLHLNKKHRSEIVKTIEDRPAAIIATNGHHREETHAATGNNLEADDRSHRLEAIATLITGRVQQIIEGMAFTHDLPARTLAALVIRTVGQASKIWQ